MVGVVAGPGRLEVRLLGPVSVRWRGRDVPVQESARAVSLLGYLLLHRDAPQPRAQVAARFWPDSTESQARTNLRHLLHNLRRTLPESDRWLRLTPQTVRWQPAEPIRLDVAEFERAVACGDHRTAVELYAGDLLEGVYDDWLAGDRERLRAGYLDALHRLAADLEQRGELAGALGVAQTLLRQDPLAEPVYQLLIRLHLARGDRARAVRAYHACVDVLERELGAHPSPTTHQLYRRLLAAGAEPAMPAGRVSGAPLVGRLAERAALTSAWRAVAGGEGARLALVTGEAGIGKTRLVEEFQSWCAHRGAVTAYGCAYPAEGPISYGLVAAWLRAGTMADQVGALAPRHRTELARLLPELLDKHPDLDRPRPLPEADQRQRLLGAIALVVAGRGAPVLLVGDDLQWADRESLRAIHYLLRADPGARLLVATTARWEDLDPRHPLVELVTALRTAPAPPVELPLPRLTEPETTALATGLLGGDEPAPATRAELYADTEGNPLFVVEAVRGGSAGLSPRVQAVIESRLARLAVPVRDLAGVAAAIGRDFGVDVLADASGAGDDALVTGLDELWRRGFIRESARAHAADSYDFSHGKLREVIYSSLTPARRRHHHLRIARALARRHPAEPGPMTGQVAAHFDRAGEAGEAVDWYLRAVAALHLLPAQPETVRLLDRARELLTRLPAGPDRDRRELAILTAQAAPLAVVESVASPRLVPLLERGLQLAASLSVPPAPPLVRWLAVASLARGEFDRAGLLGDRLRGLGPAEEREVHGVEADYVLGIAHFWQGHLVQASEHFQAAVTACRERDLTSHLRGYGLDPHAVCQSRLANTRWFLGEATAAVEARDAALARARTIGHPATLGTVLVFAALLSLELGDEPGVREHAAALADWQAAGHAALAVGASTNALAGYVDVLDGQSDRGLRRIRRVLDAHRATDQAPGARAAHLRIMLAACQAGRDAEAGLAAAEALAASDGVALWESEARRMRAELLAARGAAAPAVAAELDRALAVARVQDARLFELRALAVGLRLGALAGGARDRLAALVAELPAATGTPDLAAALAVLDRG